MFECSDIYAERNEKLVSCEDPIALTSSAIVTIFG